MNKNICSIFILLLIVFASCKQAVKPNASKMVNDKTETVSAANHNDSIHHTHDTTGTKKLTCCIGPPSRVKTKVAKK